MLNKKDFRIKKTENIYLHAHVIYPDDSVINHGNIIFIHGFLGEGCENHRMFTNVAENLIQLGYTCILYDQVGCGYSDGNYRDTTIQSVFDDLEVIYKWTKSNFSGQIGLLGQSMGSAIALSSTTICNPSFIIAINPAANYNQWLLSRYNWDLSVDTKNSCYCAFPKGIFVSNTFIQELLEWDWIKQIDTYTFPVLLIAGGCDDVNSEAAALAVKNKLPMHTSYKLIDGANHSFTGQPELENKAISIIKNWLYSTII